MTLAKEEKPMPNKTNYKANCRDRRDDTDDCRRRS